MNPWTIKNNGNGSDDGDEGASGEEKKESNEVEVQIEKTEEISSSKNEKLDSSVQSDS